MKRDVLRRTLLCSGVIHLVFIGQMLVAIIHRDLICDAFTYPFFPHAALMYWLPPGDPRLENGISWWRLIAKIIDAFPASLFYGLVIAVVFQIIPKLMDKNPGPPCVD